MQRDSAAFVPALCRRAGGRQRLWRCTNQRGYSLSQKRISPLEPQEKGFDIAGKQLEELQCLPTALPIARRCRVAVAIRFASAPIIRCCAAVGGSAALRMRHTPCGCRSAHLVEVLTNFRLPIVPTNAASAAMPLFRKQSAAVLPSLAPHDSKARLIVVTTRRDSWRSHVHRTHTAQRVQPFKPKSRNVGGRGVLPSSFLLGV